MDFLPWCPGNAVHVGWVLQAGWFCSNRQQSWIWLCHLQPLLYHSSWKTVSKSTCSMTSSGLWIPKFPDWNSLMSIVLRCRVSLGGKALSIQTYTWDNSSYGNGKKYIASAYPVTPWSCHLQNYKQLLLKSFNKCFWSNNLNRSMLLLCTSMYVVLLCIHNFEEHFLILKLKDKVHELISFLTCYKKAIQNNL